MNSTPKTQPKNILILDYSVDQIEAAAIQRWLPADAKTTVMFIDTADSFPEDLIAQDFTHVIHSGSSLCILEEAPFTAKAIQFVQTAREKGIAQFGICYGHQLICRALVGKQAVRSSPNGLEAGWDSVNFTTEARNLFHINPTETIWQSHFDEVVEMPAGATLLAQNSHTAIQAFLHADAKILGTQFHPEFDKVAGDSLYLEEREFMESHGLDVAEIIRKKPTLEAGKIFFGYFCNQM